MRDPPAAPGDKGDTGFAGDTGSAGDKWTDTEYKLRMKILKKGSSMEYV